MTRSKLLDGRFLTTLIARLKSPSAVYLGASVLARIGSFVLIPLYVRRLSAADYGEYALAQSLLVIGPPLFALGLNNAFTKFQFERADQSSPGRAGAVARWTVLVTIVVTALAAAIVQAIHPRGVGLRGAWGLTCVIVAIGGNALQSIPVVYFRNEQRAYAASVLQIFELVSVATFGWLFVGPMGRGLDGAFEATGAAYALCATVALFLIARIPAAPLDRKVLRSALAFSTPLIPHYVAVWLQGAADRWVLGFGPHEARLGPYSLASQALAPSVMIMNAWNTEQSARAGETYRDAGLEGLAKRLPRIVKSYIVLLGIATCAVLVVLPALPFIAGALSSETLLYVGPLIVIGAIDWLYCPFQFVAYYSGHSKRIAAVTTISAATNVVLSLLAVPYLGAWGALVGRAGATVLKTVCMWWVAKNILRGDLQADGRTEVPPSDATASPPVPSAEVPPAPGA